MLFGSLVRERLVTDGPLATALRCVAEAARSPPGSKLSKFAVDALTQFRDELPAWPEFCTTLLQVAPKFTFDAVCIDAHMSGSVMNPLLAYALIRYEHACACSRCSCVPQCRMFQNSVSNPVLCHPSDT